jgi:hypothetical protein
MILLNIAGMQIHSATACHATADDLESYTLINAQKNIPRKIADIVTSAR